jgi:YD repeat-containing protein
LILSTTDGNLTASNNEMGNTITFSYNSRDRIGNLLSLTDSDQNWTSYTYDALNRQLTDTNQLGV